MPALAPFVTNRLYVPGSLRNTPEGAVFELRNRVGPGSLTGAGALVVDGEALPDERFVILHPPGSARPAPGVTPGAPVAIAGEARVTFRADGVHLAPGRHVLRFCLVAREAGDAEFTIRDAVSAGPPARGAAARPAEPAPAPSPPVAARSSRPLRVAIVGAGSAVFARQLMGDFLVTPGLGEGTFVLVDVDAARLELAHRVGELMAAASGRRWTVEATAARRRALRGCDYVVNTIEVAGLRNVRHDYDIPARFGVAQCVGDTIGPGGIFKMLRTGPAWLSILRDVEELCPRAVVMNYTNPMSALTLLGLRASRARLVGLCHSVQNTRDQLAGYLDVPVEELRFRCAGINHLAWFTELSWRGTDMYPRLAELARDPEVWEADPVRFEVMTHFGAFVTESSGHLSEYLPYFRKRPDLLARYTREGYRGESGFYADNWPGWRRGGDQSIREILDGRSPLTLQRSGEFASVIVEAMEGGAPAVVHANVRNDGLIENLPAAGCVEVPVVADAHGLSPVRFGPLPPQMAALDAAHMAVHELMVEAVVQRDLGPARHALLLDPLTAAVCSPAEIAALFAEMADAQRVDLRGYRPPAGAAARRSPRRRRAPPAAAP